LDCLDGLGAFYLDEFVPLDAPLWREGCLVFYEFEGELSYPGGDSFEDNGSSNAWLDVFEDCPFVDVS
jgi:hypothetical protein